jgi:hypothetical protein
LAVSADVPPLSIATGYLHQILAKHTSRAQRYSLPIQIDSREAVVVHECDQ